jgi:hypothetical protein
MLRRHLEQLAVELRRHAVEVLHVIVEARIVIRIRADEAQRVLEIPAELRLRALELLFARVGETRQPFDVLGHDEIAKIHAEH